MMIEKKANLMNLIVILMMNVMNNFLETKKVF